MTTGTGLQFSRTLHGGTPICQKYYIPSTDATPLYENDVVSLVPTTGALDGSNVRAVVTRATSGNVLLGVVMGFTPDGLHVLDNNYRAASTARYVNVCIDPDAVYIAQEDAIGGDVTAAQIGGMYNFNLNVQDGNAGLGVSGTMIDSSTATQSAADVKVIGVVPYAGPTNYATVTGGALLECMILAPALKSTASRS